ncbi:GDSL esterase/lipase, partial [Mucuna pruriens]
MDGVDVALRGYSGYNTRWVLKVFPAKQDGDGGIDRAPVAITVFFGVNNACLPNRYAAFLDDLDRSPLAFGADTVAMHVAKVYVKVHFYEILLWDWEGSVGYARKKGFWKRPSFTLVVVRSEKSGASLRIKTSAEHSSMEGYQKNLAIGKDKYTRPSFAVKRWPTTHVILITPPTMDDEARVKYGFSGLQFFMLYPHANEEYTQGLPERTNEAAGEYARACIAVCGRRMRSPSLDKTIFEEC